MGLEVVVFFFGKRVKKLLSIESDINYFKIVNSLNKKFKKNIEFKLIKPKKKSTKIYTSKKSISYKNLSFENYVMYPYFLKKKYDLVFIDGRCRERCLVIGALLLKKKGILIFDNSNRKRYQKSLNILAEFSDIKRFYGLTYCLPYFSETLIIKNINLQLLKKSKLYKETMF